MMSLSNRTNWWSEENAIAREVRELRSAGASLIDLTETNPTQVGLPYPIEEIAEAFSRAAHAPYRPDARGLRTAREAIAHEMGCEPDRIILTASTSEAYSFLLRLLLDPGDHLITFTPGYPLFEHLAALDGVHRDSAPLEFQKRWHLNASALAEHMTPRTRLIALVSPNNPTGSYVTQTEQDSAAQFCARAGAALLSDEVFADYPIDPPPDPALPAWRRDDVLSFSLGGLSKSAGLPHLKLAWICVGGPEHEVAEALHALELVSDTFLSVSTPVQEALPDLLRAAPGIRSAIASRIRTNAAELQRAFGERDVAQVLRPEGGWSAVIRVPRVGTDETLVLELLRKEGVLVHPGYFFDFEGDGFVVVSLLPPEELFRSGVGRLRDFLLSRLR